MDSGGDAAAVVGDADHVVRKHFDQDPVAETRKGLVDGVVDDLIDQMMQSARPGGPDIHAGPFPDGFKPLQNLNLIFVV